VWRFANTAYALASVSVFLDYWTQWTGDYNGDGIEGALFTLAWVVTVPSFLMFLLSSTVLGVTLLVKRFRPPARRSCWRCSSRWPSGSCRSPRWAAPRCR